MGQTLRDVALGPAGIKRSQCPLLLSSKNYTGFPGGSYSKESAYIGRYLGSIPGLRRSPGEGNGNPLQYFCLENSMDRGAWQVIVHGVTRVRHD